LKIPIAIGAAAAIAVGVFVAVSVGQGSPSDFECLPTENNIEGPYYTAGAPAWQLPDNLPGERLSITGRVVNQDCEPMPGAVLDFWQTDSAGVYDNTGYTLRGTIVAGDDGSYRLDTIVPGKYETRPAHIHVKVWASGEELLTTQLYVINNDKDEFVKDSLIIEPREQDGAKAASFDFVVITR
jgi:protocatechuate 3,4-dioxygenase beta subunit